MLRRRPHGLGRQVGAKPEDADRLGDVLDALLAHILEAVGQLPPDMIPHAAGDADAAGLGQAFDAGGDVDAIAEDVAVLHHDVAEIDADAKPHLALRRQLLIRLREIALDLHRALDGGEDAAEFGQDAVAGGVANPPPMPRDEGIGDGPVHGEGGQGRGFVLAHQPAVALDIRGENGNELALQRWRFHAGSLRPS